MRGGVISGEPCFSCGGGVDREFLWEDGLAGHSICEGIGWRKEWVRREETGRRARERGVVCIWGSEHRW